MYNFANVYTSYSSAYNYNAVINSSGYSKLRYNVGNNGAYTGANANYRVSGIKNNAITVLYTFPQTVGYSYDVDISNYDDILVNCITDGETRTVTVQLIK